MIILLQKTIWNITRTSNTLYTREYMNTTCANCTIITTFVRISVDWGVAARYPYHYIITRRYNCSDKPKMRTSHYWLLYSKCWSLTREKKHTEKVVRSGRAIIFCADWSVEHTVCNYSARHKIEEPRVCSTKWRQLALSTPIRWRSARWRMPSAGRSARRWRRNRSGSWGWCGRCRGTARRRAWARRSPHSGCGRRPRPGTVHLSLKDISVFS